MIFQTCLHIQSQGDPEMEIDRSDSWLLARKDKNGNYKSEKIKQIADEIVSFSFM